MTRYIVGLDSRLVLKEPITGGKGSSLAWLRRQGFPVPPRYVITSRAFDDLLTDIGRKRTGHAPTGHGPASSTNSRHSSSGDARRRGDRAS